MNWTFLNIIVLLGVVQGLILSGIVLFLNKKKLSNKLLGLLLFFLSLASIGVLIDSWSSLELNLIPRMLVGHFPFFIIMPIGPLLWFYSRSVMEKDFSLGRKDITHFYPTIIDFLPFITALILVLLLLTDLISIDKRRFIEYYVYEYHTYADIPRYFSMIIYSLVTYKYLKNYNENLDSLSNLECVHLKWLNQFLIGIGVIILFWTPFLFIYISPLRKWLLMTFYYFPIYIPLTIFIYWASIKWYLLPKEVDALIFEKNKNKINEHELKEYFEIIELKVKGEKLYLNPDLSLQTLSKIIKIPSRQISATLNQYILTNFNDYINDLRVEEFKFKAKNKKFSHLTLEGLAYECGFKSRATFHRTFKKLTGVPPSEFKRNDEK